MADGGGSIKFYVVYNHIPALIVAVEANSRAAPKRTADRIVTKAKTYVPVDTGALKNSIRAETVEAGKSAIVTVNEPYAGYVEYGTVFMAAQPFLTPATEEETGAFIDDMGKGFFASFK
jgi:HK97 gp10 family phage protein